MEKKYWKIIPQNEILENIKREILIYIDLKTLNVEMLKYNLESLFLNGDVKNVSDLKYLKNNIINLNKFNDLKDKKDKLIYNIINNIKNIYNVDLNIEI